MIDNLIAFRVLWMLVQPFVETKAFKLGIIDKDGKLQKKVDELRGEEKEAYNMLVRLVFNLKRLLAKLPGGDNKLKSMAAAYFLVREHYDTEPDLEQLEEELNFLLQNNLILVEETATVMNFVSIFEDAPVNSTGPAVSTDEPVVKKRKIHKFTRDNLKHVVNV
jgi:hypothetical protein